MIRVLELYSGIGGMHFALERSCLNCEVVGAIDVNPVCNSVYRTNFPNTPLISKCITSLNAEDFDNFKADMVVMSPPCQPFTVLGKKKDVSDERTRSFQHFVSILLSMKHLPKFILLENVSGMENSQMRNEFVKALIHLKYSIQEFMLCPSYFGIPNSRKRYYLLAKLHPLKFPFEIQPKVVSDLSEIGSHSEPGSLFKNINEPPCLKYFLEKANDDYFKNYLVAKKFYKKFWLMDLVSAESRSCCCFTKGYSRHIERAGSVLQMTPSPVDLWKYRGHEECPEFILEIDKMGLRFFTPREIANLMFFPSSLIFPENMTCLQCYRVLGNSINVHVVSVLLNILTC